MEREDTKAQFQPADVPIGKDMRKELEDKWDEAFRTGKPVLLGADVVCDWCSEDFTDSNAEGGFIFESKATCPGCATGMIEKIEGHSEQRFIRARCPSGVSFANFVREYRGEGAAIRVGPLARSTVFDNPTPTACTRCNGTGAIDAPFSGSDPSCPECDGEGVV